MSKIKIPFKITGYGCYLPPKIQTSEELSSYIGKSSNWIIKHTGVKERRISKIDVDQMAAIACKEAIGDKPQPDLIINASGVPKQTIPDTSVFIQSQLGYSGIPSFSIHSTCLSFIVALNNAVSLLASHSYKNILIVSSDRGSRGRNFDEPESSALLGDAAAAIYIEKTDINIGLINYSMNTYPEGALLTQVKGGGTNLHPQDIETKKSDNLFTMNGPQVYRMARKKVYDLIKNDLSKFDLEPSDINLVVPHQASGMAVKAYSKYGRFKKSAVVDIIETTGNCVAASIPLALVLAYKEGRFKSGDLIYLIGTGAGLSIASSLLRV